MWQRVRLIEKLGGGTRSPLFKFEPHALVRGAMEGQKPSAAAQKEAKMLCVRSKWSFLTCWQARGNLSIAVLTLDISHAH